MIHSEKLVKACSALYAAGLDGVAQALWRSNATPGLWILVGSAMQGKSTAVRTALGRCLNLAGESIPSRAIDLNEEYVFSFEIDKHGKYVADGGAKDTPDSCALAFELGGEPDYQASFPKLLASCYEAEADVVVADSFKNLPLYIVRDSALKGEDGRASKIGPFSFSESSAIWAGGITTNTILTVETVTRGFFLADRFVIATYNPLRFDHDEDYFRLLVGSCQGMLTLGPDGRVTCTSARRDVAIPTASQPLRYSDNWSDSGESVATGAKFLTPKEEEE